MGINGVSDIKEVYMEQPKDPGQEERFSSGPYAIPGHPLHTLRQENLALEAFIDGPFQAHLDALQQQDGPEIRKQLLEDVAALQQIESHYRRIEELLLPYLERMGQLAPVKVMIAIHNDVLRMIRDLRDDLLLSDSESNGIHAFAAFLIQDIRIIIRQEREAYAEQAQKIISEREWGEIANLSAAYGYCMIPPPPRWSPEQP